MLTQEQADYLLPKAYNAALRAGAAILEVYAADGDDYGVTMKSDHTPLTEADNRAHNIIKDYLGRTHVPLLSEEGREMLYCERRGWDMFWMVDPLDGTKEFIKGNGEFTVNIALMVDNRPALAVVYVPYIGRIYFAVHGKGAFLRENVLAEEDAEYSIDEIMGGGRSLPLAQDAARPFRAAISRSHNTPETFAVLDAMRAVHPDMEVMEQGSSYKFCLLAEGAVDYYIRTTPTMEWDTAAGELILEQAGGSVLSYPDRLPLAYNKESLVNPNFECKSHACGL
ncbi:MAG: 3'(2'),5'-bisphosphate nucleotidase CysQ [Rikenellaceae bacterium]|nr:3'(2'),5'-bisphosphate nucleotidase CysQ [Rikenellaceae bacterium]MCL2692208.1 3'(2'),5'-bisphosphate nucleotidase CysQ [Rikenellaceae bacterium]